MGGASDGGCRSRKRKRWVFGATRLLAKMALSPLFKIEVRGLENLPRDRAFVLLPKHQRWEDIPLVGIAVRRPLYYVAKHELFQNRFSDWYLRALGGIPLNRRRPLESRRSLKTIIRVLEQGEGMVVFPEGTYYRDKMGPGHAGVVKLILSRLPLPFIPVGINYAKEEARTVARICCGAPFHWDPSDSVAAFLDHLMGEIARLSNLQPLGPSAAHQGERHVETRRGARAH